VTVIEHRQTNFPELQIGGSQETILESSLPF